MKRVIAVVLLSIASIGQAASAQQPIAEWTYTVRPGDNLWELAQRFCGSFQHTRELARHNRLADPADLRAGDRIQVPVSCLVKQPAGATVVTSDGDAQLVRAGQASALQASAAISMGDIVRTNDGFVVVQFADGSRLTIRPGSEVSFVLISAFGETGMVDTLVRVTRGRVQHAVEPGSRGSRHRIATPVGIAAVRGTVYRVGVGGADSATVATTEGEVEFEDATAQKTGLPAGTGVVASTSGAVKEDLLPAPSLAGGRQAASKALTWPPVVDAVGYRVTASQQGVPVAEFVTNDAALEPGLSNGMYLIAVRAIAASGLEGLEASREYVLADPPRNLAATVEGRDVRFSWSSDDGGKTALAYRAGGGAWQQADVQGSEHRINLPPGAYEWRVGADQQWSATAQVVIKPGAVQAVAVARDARRSPLQVTWSEPAGEQADQYFVEVSRDASFSPDGILNRTVAESAGASLETNRCRPCFVRVAAEAQGATSDYTVAEFSDEPDHPWPLYVFLAALLLAL